MKTRIYTAIAATAAIISAASCSHKKEAASQIPRIEVASPTVDSIVLHKELPATLQASSSADVVARVDGTLLRQLFTDGQQVKAGQVLFYIESDTYRNAVEEAAGALATAQSQYEYYSRQYQAMKKAFEQDAVSEINVLQAKSSMKQAAADIRSSKARLDEARRQLAYCTVTAPISGTISTSNVNVGNFVSSTGSPTVLCTIVDNSNLKVVFNISNAQYQELFAQATPEQKKLLTAVPLNFRIPMQQRYTANISYTAPSVSSSTGTLTIEGDINNPNDNLKDGMYTTVSLPYGTEPHAVMVRDASIGTDQRGKYLYVVNDSNKVVYTPVQTGELFADTLRAITQGIKPGERYVTKALLSVRNGMQIEPIDGRPGSSPLKK